MLFLTSHSYREIEPFGLIIRAYKQFPKFKDYEFKLQKPFVQDGLVQTYQTRGPFRAPLGSPFSSSETLNMTHVKTWLWTTFGCGATSVINSTGILVLEVWRPKNFRGEIRINMTRLSHDAFLRRCKLCLENDKGHLEQFLWKILLSLFGICPVSLKWNSFCIALSITVACCDNLLLKLLYKMLCYHYVGSSFSKYNRL